MLTSPSLLLKVSKVLMLVFDAFDLQTLPSRNYEEAPLDNLAELVLLALFAQLVLLAKLAKLAELALLLLNNYVSIQ